MCCKDSLASQGKGMKLKALNLIKCSQDSLCDPCLFYSGKITSKEQWNTEDKTEEDKERRRKRIMSITHECLS